MSPEIALLKDVQRSLRLQQVKHGSDPAAETLRLRVIEWLLKLVAS
jgi:hypothetical protein